MRTQYKNTRRGNATTPPARKRRALVAAIVLVAVAIMVPLGVRWWHAQLADTRPTAPSPPVTATSLPAPMAATAPGMQQLKGKWLRLDGGYILEVRDVDASGKMEAVYLNPRPIHVARAEATRNGTALQMLVELQAPGYPGSTYTLHYEPQRDQLEGSYFQATLQQRFEVVFVRMK